MKDLLRTADLSAADLRRLLDLASRARDDPLGHHALLRNQTVVLYFNKLSTRTRISFETAVARLGGVPIGVGTHELQLGRGETIEDTARVISRYARAFIVRTYADDDVRRFAGAATIPVVNALTDRHHPLQSLADMLTLRDRFGSLEGVRVAYVGAGNNVCHSLIEAAAILGLDMRVATPAALEPDDAIVAQARERARGSGGDLAVTHDPWSAVAGADAVYTDVWSSMGDPEVDRARRVALLTPYQVNEALMAAAAPHAIFMHCLPDHRGEEVSAAIVDGPRSVIFDQAENRLHTSVAVLVALIGGILEGSAGTRPC